MNQAQRTLAIRLAILSVLNDCGHYLLPEPQLFVQINLTLAPPITLAELQTELRFLESDRSIVGVNPDLGGPVKWRITDLGKTDLAGA